MKDPIGGLRSGADALEVSKLTVSYNGRDVRFRALDSVAFAISRGKSLGLVGESGSGKTTLALAVARLLPPEAEVSGVVLIRGRSLDQMTEPQIREMRRRDISFVFQDPVGSLVPSVCIGTQVTRVVAHRLGLKDRAEAVAKARYLLSVVGFSELERVWDAYPRKLSGGMCQRVMLALALATEPILVIADEPLSALDAVSQMGILHLLTELQLKHQFALLYVTHDLRVAARFDEVGVLMGGRLVELGPAQEILKHPQTASTRELVASARALSIP